MSLAVCNEWGGHSLVVVRGRLIAVATLVAEHELGCVGFSSCGQGAGSLIVAHELRCPIACGVFIDQGSDWCPLLYKKDS